MPTQLPLPFTISQLELTEFLERYTALEDEIDRLKAEMLVCKAAYEDALPMRALLVALKVTRARRKLAHHAKEPLSFAHQASLEDLVERHLDARAAELTQLTAAADALVVDGLMLQVTP